MTPLHSGYPPCSHGWSEAPTELPPW